MINIIYNILQDIKDIKKYNYFAIKCIENKDKQYTLKLILVSLVLILIAYN